LPTIAGKRPGAVLLAAALFFRLPLLFQPVLTSDAAVAGLQGLHMLRGEFSRLLWGRPYQSSLEAAIAAIFEAIFGPRHFAVTAGPVLEQLLLCWLMYRLLKRHLDPWAAAVCCLPLAIPTIPLIAPVIFGTRSLVLLAAMCGLELAESGRAALAAFLIVFSVHLDLYAVEFLPLLGLLYQRPPRALGGAAVAAVLILALRAHDTTGILASGPHFTFMQKLSLMLHTCLLAALGGYWHHLDGTPIHTPTIALAGPIVLLAAIASGAVLSPPRRLGLCGVAVSAASVAAFLGSSMPEDFWSSRYFVSLLWAAPLALAPLARRLGPGKLVAVLFPWLTCAVISAVLALDMPRSLRPAPLDGLTPSERALRDSLRVRGVRASTAGYWTAYRLTYLFAERPILVPSAPSEDRYPPYRALLP